MSCDGGFGPRPRSDEHVIPRMVLGNLITTDLCRCCNSRFGEMCDHAPAKDQRIVEAAQRMGISASDLWSRFEGVQHAPDGRPVKTVFKDGVFQPQAALSSLDALAIPSTNGQISDRHLQHLRARLIEKVRAKSLGLSDQQFTAEVDSLLSGLRSSTGEVHHKPRRPKEPPGAPLQGTRLPGQRHENSVRNFARMMVVPQLPQSRAAKQPDVPLHDQSERFVRTIGGVLPEQFDVCHSIHARTTPKAARR